MIQVIIAILLVVGCIYSMYHVLMLTWAYEDRDISTRRLWELRIAIGFAILILALVATSAGMGLAEHFGIVRFE